MPKAKSLEPISASSEVESKSEYEAVDPLEGAALRQELRTFATTLISSIKVISLADLDAACLAEFKDRLGPEAHRPMPGRDPNRKKRGGRTPGARTYFQNHIDWIKAEWTRQGVTSYVRIGGITYLLLTPTVGHIQNHGHLISYRAVMDLIGALSAEFDRRLARSSN